MAAMTTGSTAAGPLGEKRPQPRSRRPAKAELDRVEVTSRGELRSWLAANHATSPGIWLVTYKKSSPERHISWDEVVEEALCFGWIDSTANKLDAERSMLLLTPRNRRSPWSRINKERVEKLLAQGLIEPSGLAVIEAAKADGSWSVLDAVEAYQEPDDLRAALAAVPRARAGFDAFPPSARKQLLWWVESAKRPETRAKRIEETVRGATEGRNPVAYTPKPRQ
jgi:uncharacterized protein YdeI (YjbR/CyaY-like superfamily)